MIAVRDKVTKYISNQYGVDPEYPWDNYPEYTVFRHRDNKKWFALIMKVGCDKIGIKGEGQVDVINLKIDDPILHDTLVHEKGIIPGYHMNKQYWITVMLDGSVSEDQVYRLIDTSFAATGKKR